jgi:alpha-L-fucosidase
VTCAGRNGNLALNTGPMPDGRIEPRQADRFREIGRWLGEYGQSIYGTRGGPFWGLGCLTTRKDNTIYVHVLKWYDDRVLLPAISHKILSHEVLTGGTATIEQTEDGVEILVPPEQRSESDTIIALHLDGPALELEVAAITSGQLTFGRKVTASHVYDTDPEVGRQYRPQYAVDGDPRTGWTFKRDQPTAWLEVDLGKIHTFNRAWLNEPYDRIREFELQAERDGSWEKFHHGTTIGEDCELTFEPVTAQRVRLVVLKTTINPLVGEFQLFEAKR